MKNMNLSKLLKRRIIQIKQQNWRITIWNLLAVYIFKKWRKKKKKRKTKYIYIYILAIFYHSLFFNYRYIYYSNSFLSFLCFILCRRIKLKLHLAFPACLFCCLTFFRGFTRGYKRKFIKDFETSHKTNNWVRIQPTFKTNLHHLCTVQTVAQTQRATDRGLIKKSNIFKRKKNVKRRLNLNLNSENILLEI